MRCPDCSKFVSLELGDPEVDRDLDVTEYGVVTCTVRIVRTCADCGTELKEATLEMKIELDTKTVGEHTGKGHDLEIEQTGIEPIEQDGGRFAKSYFGAEVSFTLTCTCDHGQPARWSYDGEISDRIAASAMEKLS